LYELLRSRSHIYGVGAGILAAHGSGDGIDEVVATAGGAKDLATEAHA
jgi:hypothetical protein